jgi:hypothetical protein
VTHQNLGQVKGSHARRTLAQASFNMHQTTHIAPHHSINIRRVDLIQFHAKNLDRNRGMIHGEHTSKSTALRFQSVQYWSFKTGQQTHRLLIDAQVSK